MSTISPVQQINPIDMGKATSFLGQLAGKLHLEYGADMSAVTVILPNSRGAQYLKEEIRKASRGQAILLPRILGMDEWVKRQTMERIIDPLEALIFLFEAFQKVRNSEESFHTFFPLGQVLLSDFEEITRNLKPRDLIYRNLAEWEAVGINFADFLTPEQKEMLAQFWSHFEERNMTRLRERFFTLWKSLPEVFAAFENLLREKGLLTSAMAYAQLAGRIQLTSWISYQKSVWVAGFGDLSESEILLLENINSTGKLRLFWDVNSLFSENPVHEVTRLFHRLQKNEVLAKSLTSFLQILPEARPKVETVQCLGVAGMVHWLRQKARPSASPQTAYILTEPALIQLLIEQADFEHEAYNFTMGYPFIYAQQAGWLFRILNWCGRERHEETELLKEVFQHVLAAKLLPSLSRDVIQYVASEEILPPLQDLKRLFPGAPAWLWQTTPVDWLREFLSWWKAEIIEVPFSAKWEPGYYALYDVLLELAERLRQLPESQQEWKVVRLLLPPLFYRNPLGLAGDFQHGIQVMGLYESRVLDFEEVVIAPAEEGKIPSGSNQTFLTENIRRAFGMANRTQRTEDEMYQLYRLFFRARRVTLLVNSSADSKPSRVLEQIRYGNDWELTETRQQYGHSLPIPQQIIVTKNQAVDSFIAQYSRSAEQAELRSFSPSSLYDLIVCKLHYYYKYVEKLKAPDDHNGLEMRPEDFGNWIHETIQRLYELHPPKGTFLSGSDYDSMKSGWESEQYKTWSRLFPDPLAKPLQSFPIEMAVGEIMSNRFFSYMADQAPHRWIAGEKVLQRGYIKSVLYSDLEWAMEGRADLIFESENEHWIVDLKTGSFQADAAYLIKPEKLENLESKIIKNKELLQMLIYNWLNTNANTDKISRAFLFHLANPEAKLVDPVQAVSSREEWNLVMSRLWEILISHLDQWKNSELPIRQTDDAMACQYCDFKAICQR